jgi:hypothetical protein
MGRERKDAEEQFETTMGLITSNMSAEAILSHFETVCDMEDPPKDFQGVFATSTGTTKTRLKFDYYVQLLMWAYAFKSV